MNVRWEVILIILGSGLVTFVPRVLPLMTMSRLTLPKWLMSWLDYVPIAVISALIAQQVFTENGEVSSLSNNIELLSAIPTFLIATKTRSLLITVLTGILSYMLIRFILYG